MNDALEVTLRRARAGDRDQLIDLKCEIWPQVIRANELVRWEWEFDHNPAYDCAHPTTLVLEEGGQCVGLFTLIPYRVRIGGAVSLACAGADLCVRSRHRGRGFSRLLVERWMSPGTCGFSFATTATPVVVHVITACGGRSLGRTAEFQGRGETLAYAWFVDGVHREMAEQSGDTVTEVTEFCGEWDELWKRIRQPHRLLLVRDARYLNWRYRDFPFQKPTLLESRDANRELTGVAVVQVDVRNERLYLCELLAAPSRPAAIRGLLWAALDIARSSGQKILYCATRDGSVVHHLQTFGFEPVTGEFPRFLGHINVPDLRAAAGVTDWFISLGDGDQLYNVGEPSP